MRIRSAALAAGLLLLAVAALSLTLLEVRGFRASSTPGALESGVARWMRNAAIPRAERRRSNPIAGDPVALARGREAFLARCAVCHGVDGRGATPIGANEYPRVPDLRSEPTQSLSDGELHYIIENGVQLTGMPALRGAHAETDAESWKLTAYVRSLRASTPGEAADEEQALQAAHSVGSESCAKCHAAIYERWKKTPMANVVLDPRQHPQAILPDLKTNHVAPFTLDQVALVYGSKWKQRYFTRIGDDYYPLPVQWDVGNKRWLAYHVPDHGADWWAAYYPSDNLQRPTGPTCDGCHSVSYDIHRKEPTEWNVGCEECHGPGSAHVAHPTRSNIVNPAAMDAISSDDTCIQCHSQGRPRGGLIEGKAYDWPVGYRVGLHLADYWRLEEVTLGQTDFYHYADGTAHKNRMQGNDFVQSAMYRHGVTCATCHDAHGTGNPAQLREPADRLCLDCHGPGSPNGPHEATLAEHTHHKDGSAGSECIACHMPKIESEGVPGSFVRSHTFRFISPAMTDRYKMPNPCTTCHADKTTAWAAAELAKWPNVSPWRVGD